MGKLLHAASQLEHLHRAARDVSGHVRRTSWPQLLAELQCFEQAPIRRLRKIQRELREGTYTFAAKWAYAKRKSGGSRRGITVHGIEDRIVQRSLLNVIHSSDAQIKQHLGGLPAMLHCPTSFAGVPGRGVPEAIDLAWRTIRRGARAYAYSDMKDFFPCVPRHSVVELLRVELGDVSFVELFAAALETELAEPADVDPWLELFPSKEVGVAQGTLLSTLVGNLALREFDVRLNNDRWTTIRYLDDFLVLADDVGIVNDGFAAAVEELAKLKMVCYQPGDGSQKAALGLATDGFDFLGCRVHPDGVSPARRVRRKLVRDVRLTIQSGKQKIRRFVSGDERRRTELAYTQTLSLIDRKLRGWGDAYSFVSNRVAFSQLDLEVGALLDDFERWFRWQTQNAAVPIRRRSLGVTLLADTPNRHKKRRD